MPCVVSVVGTRPEAIKMAPVVCKLRQRSHALRHVLVSTRQHREVLDQAFAVFGLKADIDLKLNQQSDLGTFASSSLEALSRVMSQLRPCLAIVQGDTTSTLTGALAAFYQSIPVAHVEAGLRSFDVRNPFPEEANRRCVTNLATLHFAPTAGARANLLAEGVHTDSIFVTGNTIIDALAAFPVRATFQDPALAVLDFDRERILFVTAHRRENHPHLDQICAALRVIVERFADCRIVFVLHPNPALQVIVARELAHVPRISIVQPLAYPDCLRILSLCHVVLTDSGGLQEEAPSFGKPVLVLRNATERPELISAGGGSLVGVSCEVIVEAASRLLSSPSAYREMCVSTNPFGDGNAAERIADIVESEVARRSAVGAPL